MDFPSDFFLLWTIPILFLSFYETLSDYIKHMGKVCKNVKKNEKKKKYEINKLYLKNALCILKNVKGFIVCIKQFELKSCWVFSLQVHLP